MATDTVSPRRSRPGRLQLVRVSVVASALVLVVLGIGWFISRDLKALSSDTNRATSVLLGGLDLLDRLQFNVQETRRTVLYALATTDANQLVGYAKRSRRASAEVDRVLDREEVVTVVPTPEAIAGLRASWREYLEVRDEIIGLLLEGDEAAGVALDLAEGARRFDRVEDEIAALRKAFEAHATRWVADVEQRTAQTLRRVAALGGTSLVAIAGALLLLHRRMGAERALREEARRTAMLGAMLDAVIRVGADDRIEEVNAPAESMFGFRRGTMVGSALGDLLVLEGSLAPGGIGAALEAASHVDAGGRIEVVARRRDGSTFPAELRMVALEPDEGVCFTANIRDITRRRAIEDELRQAKLAAEAAAQARSEFVATLSHEIRTPVNVLTGMTSLLASSPLSQKQREWVDAGRASGEALLSVIDNVLDFSRIDAGQLEIDPQPTDVRGLVDDMLEVVAVGAHQKGLSLSHQIGANVPRAVVVDSARVGQILLNLLTNAVKFTEQGEVRLVVEATPAPPAGVVVLRFEVADTGIGISPDELPKLFERFRQADASIGRRYGGSGLGLAISARLAELLGGGITVSSAQGKGSTFVFSCLAERLELMDPTTGTSDADDSEGAAAPAGAKAVPFDSGMAERHPLRILLVDDDEGSRRVTGDLLAEFGYVSDFAADGREAAAAVTSRTYDLVLMDLEMPELDGIQTVELLRARLGAGSPRFVALTASTTADDRRRCEQVGMSGFLAKPLRVDVLRATLQATPGRTDLVAH